jgi:hypothetical protein
MKTTKSQLRQIIKEEINSMLNRPRTAEQFLKMIKSQFRLAGTRKTLEMMAKYYDAMIKAAAERAPLKPSDPKEIAAEIGIAQDSPYLQWATFHLNKLQQVPREAYEILPASDELTAMHYDRLAAKEKKRAEREAKLSRPRSPEEKEAAAIKFGQDMAAGKYGPLD